MAIKHSDGIEIEAVFQSLGPSLDAPVLTSPSGLQRGEQAGAREVVVLDDLPVTSGAVGVMEGRQFAPDDALCRPHHPLERPAVAGGAVGDTARQEALNCASVKVCEGFRC